MDHPFGEYIVAKIGKCIDGNLENFAIEDGVFTRRTIKAVFTNVVLHLCDIFLCPFSGEKAFI